MKKLSIYIVLVLSLVYTSCRDDDGKFDSSLYVNGDIMQSELLFKKGAPDVINKISVALPQPQAIDVKYSYYVSESNVAVYNGKYGVDAVMLPEENYEFSDEEYSIPIGNVTSLNSDIKFKNLGNLDTKVIYVLPVSVKSSNFTVLNSDAARYYKFVGSSLINVTADMTLLYATPKWTTPEPLKSLTAFTLEALVRVKKTTETDAPTVQTIMGIEQYALFRMGTNNHAKGQIHFCSWTEYVPGQKSSSDFSTYSPLISWEWVHLAVTRAEGTSETIVYMDGVEKWRGVVHGNNANGKQSASATQVPINFVDPVKIKANTHIFHIGRATKALNRSLNGNMSEVRIWNKVRTQEEIKSNPYYVDPVSEGLVAYWKFDDGSGSKIKDHSVNGNHATVFSDIGASPLFEGVTPTAPVWENISLGK